MFAIANGLTSSTIYAGSTYLIPGASVVPSENAAAIGRSLSNGDNARLAALQSGSGSDSANANANASSSAWWARRPQLHPQPRRISRAEGL